jgi:hypothetical protein
MDPTTNTDIPNLPVRDLGSFARSHVPSDADIKGTLFIDCQSNGLTI